jgi:heme/copper-type cytochrome/quinol oxidase subunit 3
MSAGEGFRPPVAGTGDRRATIPNGIWGMAIFIASEGTLLSVLIATYFYLRANVATWPPPGVPAPSVALPLALTGALLVTAAPMALAGVTARRGRPGPTWALVAVATLVQCGYLAWQITLYISDLGTFSPSASAYGSIYFTLLGADHAHVLVGILFNLWILARLAGGLTRYRVVTVQAVALYWVFVGALTLAVTLTQISPS